MSVVLSALVPVCFIILIGIIAGQTLTLERQTLSQLALYILSPALIAGSLYRTTLSANSMANLLTGLAIISVLIYAIVWGVSKLFQLPPLEQKSLVAGTLFGNVGNLGLPFNTFALGEAGLERAIVYLIGASILIFGFGPAIITGGGLSKGLRLTLKMPLFWAMLGGLTLRILAIELPWRLDDGIKILGDAAIPLALIVLGMQLAQTRFQVGIYEISAAVIRLLVCPAIAYLVGRTLGLEGLDLQVLILQSAMPTAVYSVVLVTQFGGDASRVARTTVVSTLLSFLTLPTILWLCTTRL